VTGPVLVVVVVVAAVIRVDIPAATANEVDRERDRHQDREHDHVLGLGNGSHDRKARSRNRAGETPVRGILRVPISSTQVPLAGDSAGRDAGYAGLVSLTAGVHRLVAARPWQARSAGPRPGPPGLVDVAVAVAALAGSLALITHGGNLAGVVHSRTSNLDAARMVLVTLATVPLFAWRRSPLGVFALTASASILLAAAGIMIWPPLGPATALYLLASSRDDAAPWTPRSAGVVVVLLIAYLGAGMAALGFAGSDLIHAGLAYVAAWFAGERTRLRREQMTELRQRAVLAEQQAARERQLAVAEERARIARDLHDSAGHALNVITVRAGAARLRHDREPERSRTALAAIEDIARQTVADIDQFIGTLRADDARAGVIDAPPGLASLGALLAQHTAAGLRVTVTRTGMARAISAAPDQAAYRILQEALTNAARHGTGTARVELGYGEMTLKITITNPMRAGLRPAASRGHGVIGMHERVALLGGQLAAERAGDTFRVDARIPYAGRCA
jgi:signal transduction histidine kinase